MSLQERIWDAVTSRDETPIFGSLEIAREEKREHLQVLFEIEWILAVLYGPIPSEKGSCASWMREVLELPPPRGRMTAWREVDGEGELTEIHLSAWEAFNLFMLMGYNHTELKTRFYRKYLEVHTSRLDEDGLPQLFALFREAHCVEREAEECPFADVMDAFFQWNLDGQLKMPDWELLLRYVVREFPRSHTESDANGCESMVVCGLALSESGRSLLQRARAMLRRQQASQASPPRPAPDGVSGSPDQPPHM